MINVIPYPAKVEEKSGSYILPDNITLSVENDEWYSIVERVFSKRYGVSRSTDKAVISIFYDDDLANEGYKLIVSASGVAISAKDNAGVLYATTTLRQLVGLDLKQAIPCPCINIVDEPRFEYRGMMLDVSRHFFDKEIVKSVLDMLAYLKMNVFHWHLTDDNGWRVEIKKYPLLNEIASKRNGTHVCAWNKPIYDETPHSGIYSQEDIKEIVSYASALNIEVIPEIDMPAHFRAAIAAYPALACREEQRPVPWYFATPKDVPNSKEDYARIACAGKESTFQFIFDVIDELTELFPSKYFHIGGDEAPKDEWKKCPLCQQRIKAEGLSGEEDLQGYFNKRVSDYLKKKGKTLICWNDALHSKNGADRSIVCQYYTSHRDLYAEKHINEGGKMIVSKYLGFYFDYGYKDISLKNAYTYKILQDGINKKNAENILGVECTFWTEWIPDKKKLDFQMYPRIEACAEQGWSKCYSGSRVQYKEFLIRHKHFESILDSFDIYYARDEVVHAPWWKQEKWRRIWHLENTQVELEYQEGLDRRKKR